MTLARFSPKAMGERADPLMLGFLLLRLQTWSSSLQERLHLFEDPPGFILLLPYLAEDLLRDRGLPNQALAEAPQPPL
jgi:hypothetical protein